MDETDAPQSPAEVKRALRAGARVRRQSADPAERVGLEDAWADQVVAIVRERAARVVAVYVSHVTEPPTAALVRRLADSNVRVLVPILRDDRDLDWADHAAPDIGLGPDAIAAVDLVVMPALSVGLDGARLGQGGGSYDRALGRVRDATPLVALVHDDEVVAAGVVPVESHDRRVTHVVTPTRSLAVGDGLTVLPVDPELEVTPRSGDLDVALVVAAGGAIGAAARYGLNTALPHHGGGFPWSTFIENVGGAFLLGVVAVVLMALWSEHRYARPFLAVGVLGGFTTFSTFTADLRTLTADGHATTALLYLVLTLVLGCGASVLGIVLGRRLVPGRRP